MWQGRRGFKMTYIELTVRMPFITAGTALQLGVSQNIIDTGNDVDVAPEGKGFLINQLTTALSNKNNEIWRN